MSFDEDVKFVWKCPRLGCKYEAMAMSDFGLTALKQRHVDQHFREDRERSDAERLKTLEQRAEAAEKYKDSKPSDKLKLTYLDVTFLETRHIRVDAEDLPDGPKSR